MEKAKSNGHVEPPARSTWRSILIVTTCTLGMIANNATLTATTIALPTIQRSLNISEVQLNWVVSGYPLTSGCLLLFFGRIADLYGRKKSFLLGSLWLLAFSLACGFAQDRIALDILRAIQGIGAASSMPAALGILAHAFPPSKARTIAFATFAAGAPVGGAFGMAIGGALTQLTQATWRSPFFFIAGVVALTILLGLVSIDADHPSTIVDRRIDWLGGFLVTAGLVLIVFVLGQGESAPNKWATPYIIALLILGVIFVFLFIAWQHYLDGVHSSATSSSTSSAWWTPPPLMSLTLWTRHRGRVAVMFCIAFLNWCSFLGWFYWVQLYYQNFAQYSPLQTVARLVPMFVTGILCNIFVAFVVGHVSLIYLIGCGTAVTSVASLLFAVINPNARYWAFGFPAAIVAVVGADFVYSAGTLYIAKVSQPQEQSVAGGLFQTVTQIGSSVGITVSTVVFNRVLLRESAKAGIQPSSSGTNAPVVAQLLSYKAAQWTCFAFGVIASILAFTFFGGVGVVGHREEKSLDRETDSGKPVDSSAEKPAPQSEDSGDESGDSKEKPAHQSEDSGDESSDSKKKPAPQSEDSGDEASDSKEKQNPQEKQ